MRDAALRNRQDLPNLHLQLEKPRIVQFPQPNPRVPQLERAAPEPPRPENETRERFISFPFRWVGFIVGFVLVIMLLLWWSGNVIRIGHREIGVPETAPITIAESPAAQPTVPLTADMLHVSAIALGKIRLAVVNGESLKEGDSLTVKTPAGEAVIRVTQIEDGTVRFKYGAQTIDVRISAGRMH